jgi:hypothetical protein
MEQFMSRKRYTPEETNARLRTAEIEQSKGSSQEEAARLRKIVSDQALNILILTGVSKGNF